MQNIYYSKQCYHLPSEYNELTKDQLIAIASLFTEKLPEDIAQLRAMRILLNKSLYSFLRIPNDAKERMLEYMQWVFEKNTLTEQIIPTYKHWPWSSNYYGARKEFDNLIMAEFHYTEINYHDYVVDNDTNGLNNLVAVLCRPGIKDYNHQLDNLGDARIAFNANEIAFYAKKIARWPLKVKLAILMFYDGCRQKLLEDYKTVFKGNSGQNNDAGMFDVIRGLSGNVYGTIEHVERLNIHTAMSEITKQIKEAEEIERKSKV